MAGKFAKDTAFPLLFPAGTQIKKTVQGVQTANEGASKTDKGNVRFVVPKGENLLRSGMFGQYSSPEAKKYFDNNGKPLSDKQSQEVLSKDTDAERKKYYDFAQSTQGVKSGSDNTSKSVTKLVKDGQQSKAIRKANEWNAQVDAHFEPFLQQYGADDQNLLNLIDSYKIDVSPKNIKRRGKQSKDKPYKMKNTTVTQ